MEAKSDDAVGALSDADWKSLREFLEQSLTAWKKVGDEWHFYPAKHLARLIKAVVFGNGTFPSPQLEPCGSLGKNGVYFPRTLRAWAKNLVNNIKGRCRSRGEVRAMREAIARMIAAVPHDEPV